jgi:hypothetical protein
MSNGLVRRLVNYGLVWLIGPALGAVAIAGDRPTVLSSLLPPMVVQPLPTGLSVAGPHLVTSTDTRIGDRMTSYLDPEFLIDHRLMVWQDFQNNLWLCQFDPETGALIPEDGKGTYVGPTAPLLQYDRPLWDVVFNGGEFGISREGVGVYFCTGSQRTEFEVARFDVTTGTMKILAPGKTTGCLAAFATRNPDDEQCDVFFGRLGQSEADTPGRDSRWFNEARPDVQTPFQVSSWGKNGIRWLPGQRAILLNAEDSNGVAQIGRYDLNTAKTTLWTTGPGSKRDATPTFAPEFGNEMVFLAVNEDRAIEVYRRSGSSWRCITRITGPANSAAGRGIPEVGTAEFVTYQGATYITYIVKYPDDSTRVCLASLDGRLNTPVSMPSALRQYDPEGVGVGNKLFVYYYQDANADGVNEFHRCDVQLWP